MAHCAIHVHRLTATVYRDKRTYYNSVIPQACWESSRTSGLSLWVSLSQPEQTKSCGLLLFA